MADKKNDFDNIINSFVDKVVEKLLIVLNQKSSTKERSEDNSSLKFYNSQEVCNILHISKSKLYRHRREGLLIPSRYIGRMPLYNTETINNYLNNFKL